MQRFAFGELTRCDNDGRRGDCGNHVRRDGLLWTGSNIELPLECERCAIAVVADCNDQIVSRGDLVFENRTGGEFWGVVRHRWYSAAVVLISGALVYQHDTCGIILAAPEAGHESEAGVRIDVDEVISAVLEVQAIGIASRTLPPGETSLIAFAFAFASVPVHIYKDMSSVYKHRGDDFRRFHQGNLRRDA